MECWSILAALHRSTYSSPQSASRCREKPSVCQITVLSFRTERSEVEEPRWITSSDSSGCLDFARHDTPSAEFFDNPPHGFARSRMRGDWPADADVVCARFNCLARGHEPFLITRIRPVWPNSLDGDFESVAQLASQGFDFMWTGDDSVDSCLCAYPGQTDYLVFDVDRDSNLAQRLFSGAG